jgi:hypothetical protein
VVRILPEDAIVPLYTTEHASDLIPLFNEYDMELRTPTLGLIFGKGNIEFRWEPIKSVHFELRPTAGTNIFRLRALVGQNAVLNVSTNPPISFDVRINHHNVGLNSGSTPTGNLAGLASATRFDEAILCDELKFHIVNLHDYFGKWIPYTSQSSAARRIALSDDNWEITIDGVENLKELLDELGREGGYAITHVGVLRKRNKQPFKVAEALEQMKQLGFFLSFVEGRWCHPKFLIGMRNEEIVFRDLPARGRITQWDNNWRWSPSEANDLDQAYKCFVSKWNDPNLKEPIAMILEFYVRANIYHVVELSVLDSFTAMDRIASAYSLENVRVASDRIRQALTKAGLDTQNPQRELCKFYDDFYRIHCPRKTADGATILADFRNGVVHGNHAIVPGDMKNRPKLDDDDDASNPLLPFPLRIAAGEFGLWCVEMSLLYLIRYNGHYCDRITKAQDVPIQWSRPFAT